MIMVPDAVFNAAEVGNLLHTFLQMQFTDDPETRRLKRRTNHVDMIDPKTLLFVLNCLATVATYLPHANPNYIELLKLPFKKTIGELRMISDKKKEFEDKPFTPEERAIAVAAAPYIKAVLDSPAGKNLLQEDINPMTILRCFIKIGEYYDFGPYVLRAEKSMTSRIAMLLLQSGQKYPVIANVQEIFFDRMINEDGVIYREDLQQFLLEDGLQIFEEMLLKITDEIVATKEESRQDLVETRERSEIPGRCLASPEMKTSKLA